MKIAVEIRDLTVLFDDFAAIDGVSLTVERGTSFGLVGESPVRLTIDRNLVGARADDWNLDAPIDGQHLLHGEALLEMKFHLSLPDLFRDLLPQLPTQPARVSKYRRCVNLCGLAGPVILSGPHEQRIAAS